MLLILLPSFGKVWAHPSTHWGMALVVIPIAVYMMRKGYKKHGKKWIVAVGSLGVALIVVGAILPYTGSHEPSSSPSQAKNTALASPAAEAEQETCATAPG